MSTESTPRVEPATAPPTGAVLLTFDDPSPIEVPALIITREAQGFRLRHHCATLKPGQIVSFHDIYMDGKAQVIATEPKHGYVETRFWVVGKDD